jgi:hypothetical protein
VMCEAWGTGGELAAFAVLRTANVVVGVLAALAVATLRDTGLSGRDAGRPVRMAGGTRVDDEVHFELRLALQQAMPGGIAVAVMAALFCWHDLHALAQAMARSGQWRYAAIQFTVAFLMVFVQDGGWHADVEAASGRFAGIAIGVALMMTVLISIDGIRAAAAGRGDA